MSVFLGQIERRVLVLSLPFRMIATIPWVEISALTEGTSSGSNGALYFIAPGEIIVQEPFDMSRMRSLS